MKSVQAKIFESSSHYQVKDWAYSHWTESKLMDSPDGNILISKMPYWSSPDLQMHDTDYDLIRRDPRHH